MVFIHAIPHMQDLGKSAAGMAGKSDTSRVLRQGKQLRPVSVLGLRWRLGWTKGIPSSAQRPDSGRARACSP